MSSPESKASSDLLIVFGKSGSGKSTTADFLEEHFDYYQYDQDSEHTDEYKDILRRGEIPTEEMRLQIVQHIKKRIPELQQAHSRVAINWVFFRESYRTHILESFPSAEFFYVKTDKDVIRQRLEANPRTTAHVNPHRELSLQLGDIFEEPKLPHRVVHNNGSKEDLLEQLHVIFSTNSSTE